MADDDQSEGLLSQDDINAALAAAGLDTTTAEAPPDEAPAEPPAADTGDLSQAAIDAALAEAAGGDASAPASPAEEPEPPAPESSPEPDTRLDSAGRPFDEVAAAMAAAIEAEAPPARSAPPPPPAPPPPGSSPLEIPELDAKPGGAKLDAQGIGLLRDVKLDVKIELGRSRMLVDDVLRLNDGSVVELDKLAGDPVDVLVNGRLIARGEVLVLNDNFCVRINEIVSRDVDEQD